MLHIKNKYYLIIPILFIISLNSCVNIDIVKNLYDEDEFQQVVATCDEMIGNGNNMWELYLFKGLSHMRSGDKDKAEKSFIDGLQIKNDSAVLNTNLGFLYHHSFHDSEKALHFYNITLEIKPDYISTLINRSTLYSELGKYKLCLEDLKRAGILMEKHQYSEHSIWSNKMSILDVALILDDYNEIINAYGALKQIDSNFESWRVEEVLNEYSSQIKGSI